MYNEGDDSIIFSNRVSGVQWDPLGYQHWNIIRPIHDHLNTGKCGLGLAEFKYVTGGGGSRRTEVEEEGGACIMHVDYMEARGEGSVYWRVNVSLMIPMEAVIIAHTCTYM